MGTSGLTEQIILLKQDENAALFVFSVNVFLTTFFLWISPCVCGAAQSTTSSEVDSFLPSTLPLQCLCNSIATGGVSFDLIAASIPAVVHFFEQCHCPCWVGGN